MLICSFIPGIPVTEEILVAELCVVCNVITCHLIQGICPVDQSQMLLLPSIQKCWNLTKKEGHFKTFHIYMESRLSRFKILAVKKISSSDFCFVTGNDLCATADMEIKRGNLIHGLMEHLMSSALSGK